VVFRLTAGLVLIGLSFLAQGAEKVIYNFSPVNQYNLKLSASFWNPIIEYVSGKSGVQLNLKLGRTSADTTSFVLAQEVDFAFTNHLFSPERSKMGWKVFSRRNAAPVQGQIVVPASSPVRTLEELNGLEVAYPGPEAFIAYKVTNAELTRRDIKTSTIFAGNMDGAFSQLFSGRVQAMGANSQMVGEYAAREGKSFRILWSSQPFNDLALMASPRVPQSELVAVAHAFNTMADDPQGRSILEQVAEMVHAPEPVSFVPASENDYLSYREFYKNLPIQLR
jgi:phosphonate transport system substrate-binding protein